MEEPPISRRLLQQRIRNGIIGYLETASSADEQHDYQRAVPFVHVAPEMSNQWEDWVREDDFDWYSPPVFSMAENAAIRAFHVAWANTADVTPDPMPQIDELIGAQVWERFMRAARTALEVFEVRGRFDQEAEERFAE